MSAVRVSTVDSATPHSIEAEQSVLGAVLITPEVWPKAQALLREEDFFRSAHATIFKAIRGLSDLGVAIDLVTLAEALGPVLLEDIGGRAYLVLLTDGVPRSTNIEHYAAIVREKARLRRLIKVGRDLEEQAYGEVEAASVLVQQALGDLSNVVQASGTGLVTAEEAVRQYAESLYRGDAGRYIPTGYYDLDALIGGFKPGDFIIVAARPSVGKSSFGLGAARNMAMRDDPTADFSLEMSQGSLAARLLGWDSGVSTVRMERQLATQEEYQRAADAVGQINYPLRIETESKTVTEITAWARLAKQAAGGLVGIVVDYLQLVVPERRRDSEGAEIASVSRAFKALAKELGIFVVALSQLNRAPETRKDKRPHIADLRGSGALEQDCDVALLLFREEMHTPKPENLGVAEVIVAKNRNGPTGVVRLAWISELAMFGNLARQDGMGGE